jgi:hypothetical protein
VAVPLLAALALLGAPAPAARANVACELASGTGGAITGGLEAVTGGSIGIGNPAGELCNTVTGKIAGAITSPITGALKGIGSDVFGQLTTWVAQGASWLMGQVVSAIDKSTAPKLETEGFLAEYGRMAAIAALLAAAMLLLAILEGIAQGNPGLLARVVLVNVPLAFLGTSLAYAVVQLLLGCTDGLSAAIASASHHNSQRFFEVAIGELGHIGGEVGKASGKLSGEVPTEGSGAQVAGTVEVPLFVGFLAAIVGAFAAFFVWLELLMRDAAVYAVALFMPLALAASIWPRWTGALRRTGELLVAVIGSKFVIVAIVSLAASLVSEKAGSVEHVLAAAALMCLACFAPFVLLRLIPFSEGALAAAYGRRSSAGGAVSALQIGSDVQILRNMSRSRGEGSGVSLWSAGGGGNGGAPKGPGGGANGSGGPPGLAGRGGGKGGGGSGAGGGEAGASAAAGGPAAAAAAPRAVVGGAKGAAGKLADTGVAQSAGSAGSGGGSEGSGSAGSSAERPARPQPESSPPQAGAGEAGGSSPAAGERPPRPSAEPPGPKGGQGGGAS